jgi:YhcH/YjgK/YiaL family protein
MILADLKDFKRYCHENEKMQKAFNFIQETDLQALELGKYLIDGDDIFALVQSYTTKEDALCRFESHKRYIDIQFIIDGVEKMSWLPVDKLTLTEDDLAKSDKILYKNTIGNDFIVNEGQFVVFYPEDGHKACITVNEPCLVKKIVLKVCLT